MPTVKDLINQKKPEFDKIFDFYKSDIATIRTGRANPAIVEAVAVNYFDQKYRVKELATITTPEPRTINIQPWDKGAVEAIAGAIRNSDLGLNPVVDGMVIRLNIPPLTEERRREFIKLLKQKSEDAKVKLRRAREEVWTKVQHLVKDGQLREDDKFRAKDDLQKLIDDFQQKVENLESKKGEELMS